jgi:hypothetical protein
MKYFGHIKRHEGLENRIMEGYIPERRKKGRPKRRWLKDMTDELPISALDVRHLAFDRVVFRRVVKGAKFCQGHATE